MVEAAPLFGLAASPPPAGTRARWFPGSGGHRLRAAIVPAVGETRGSVILSPGRTEPIEKYFETAGAMARRGFVVVVHDWRGQGLSHRTLADRRLGHADGHADFLADYQALLATFAAELPRPWIAVGHSMGGCLTLMALAAGETRMSGALLSAPMLGILTGDVPRPAARVLASVFKAIGRGGQAVFAPPGSDKPAPFEANVLTHDPVRYARNLAVVDAAPDLALGLPTWGWLEFAFSAGRWLESGAGLTRVAIPVTILTAAEDALVDNVAVAKVAAQLADVRVVPVRGARHELFQETDAIQAPVWRAFDDLAAAVCGAPG